jgi:threonine dehydrogenase-like Zn-dependent dehydrogenase
MNAGLHVDPPTADHATPVTMRAIAVLPGQANSIHLASLPRPRLDDIPDGRGVLVKVLRVGVDGTDKEINAAEYGAAPEGFDFLVTGHESFGRVEAVGPAVTELRPGDYVVATVRRPGSSLYDRIGTYDRERTRASISGMTKTASSTTHSTGLTAPDSP